MTHNTLTPDITDSFSCNGINKNRVTGYLREVTLEEALSGLDMTSFTAELLAELFRENYAEYEVNNEMRVTFCTQDEAEFITGVGVCGSIVRIASIDSFESNPAFADSKEEQTVRYENAVAYGHLKDHVTTISKR